MAKKELHPELQKKLMRQAKALGDVKTYDNPNEVREIIYKSAFNQSALYYQAPKEDIAELNDLYKALKAINPNPHNLLDGQSLPTATESYYKRLRQMGIKGIQQSGKITTKGKPEAIAYLKLCNKFNMITNNFLMHPQRQNTFLIAQAYDANWHDHDDDGKEEITVTLAIGGSDLQTRLPHIDGWQCSPSGVITVVGQELLHASTEARRHVMLQTERRFPA